MSKGIVQGNDDLSKAMDCSAEEVERVRWAERLNEFMSSKRPGAFTVLGEWGAGKTHLFHNVIAKVIEGKGRKILYVSLYSYSKGRSLDDFIIEGYSGLNGIDGESKAAAIGTIKAMVGDFVDGKGKGTLSAVAAVVGGAVKRRIVDALGDYIFCFDDIDRIDESERKRAWAEINYLVEVQRRKVILLLDETRMPGGTVFTPEFEKNIWGIHRIRPSSDQIVVAALALLDRDSAEELRKFSQYFDAVVAALAVRNIRACHSALEVLRSVRSKITIASIDEGKLAALYQFIFFARLLVFQKGSIALAMLKDFAGEFNLVKYRANLGLAKLTKDSRQEELPPEKLFYISMPDFHFGGFILPYLEGEDFLGDIDGGAYECFVLRDFESEKLLPPEELQDFVRRRRILDEGCYLRLLHSSLEFLKELPAGGYALKPLVNLIYCIDYDFRHQATDIEWDLSGFLVSVMQRFVDGLESGKYLVSGVTHDDYENAPKELRDLIGRVRVAGARRQRINEVRLRIDGWQNDLVKLSAHVLDSDYSVLEVVGLEAFDSYWSVCTGDELLRLYRIFTERFSGHYPVRMSYTSGELSILQALQDYVSGYDECGYKRIACKEIAGDIGKIVAVIQKNIAEQECSPGTTE